MDKYIIMPQKEIKNYNIIKKLINKEILKIFLLRVNNIFDIIKA